MTQDPSSASFASPASEALVFAGGEPPGPGVRAALRRRGGGRGAFVVAADSGLDHALALDVAVDLVVGDLDSVDPTALATARAAGTRVEVHPADKDATDLELALCAARDAGASRITVVGGGGGRHDHLLANALVLTAEAFAAISVEALVGTAHCSVVRSRSTLHGPVGSLCSLVPVGGTAHGVTTTGLRFALLDDDLHPGSTRGVSNELTASEATVSVRAGVVLAIQPHALEER
jgi:thiamine pyrophosphokinase